MLPWLIFFMSFVAMSPIFFHMNWRGIYSLIIVTFILLFFWITGRKKLKLWFVNFVLVSLITATITALYWGDSRYLLSLLFVYFSVFIAQFFNTTVLDKVINISSFFILVILILAAVGFLLAQMGISPILDFPNPDGRTNYFFYTTLTNIYEGNYIRPSGIYDEPGALSFYTCFIAAIRHLVRKDNKLTWIILSLGFISFSLAHLIYCLIHLISEKLNKKNLIQLSSVILISLIMIFSTDMYKTINDRLIERLSMTENGTLAGDNRSYRMFNAIELIKSEPNIFLFGADPSCRFDYSICQKKFPPIGENPLSPLAFEGILVSWPYYFILLFLLGMPIAGRHYLVCVGIGLLLLQRPSALGLSAAMVTIMLVYICCNLLNNSRLITRFKSYQKGLANV